MSANLIIVEDELLIRMQLKSMLIKLGYTVVGEFNNSDQFIDQLSDLTPDLFLFDINIKGTKDGIDLGHIVHTKHDIPFVYITSYADAITITAAKQTHPSGYIVKPFDEKDLLTTIEIALFNSPVKNTTKPSLTKDRIESRLHINLTEREYVTLMDVSLGLTNSQVAAKQQLSINTIKTHLKNLYSKIGASDRVNLVKKVLELA